jgi:hypothetical protein
MPAAEKDEFPALLPSGFHTLDVDDRRRLCVDDFPSSATRPIIMANLERLIVQIDKCGITGEIWIDGSFMTEKLNPDDVDIALIISQSEFANLSIKQRLFFSDFCDNSYYDALKIDNYGVVIDNTDNGRWTYCYWLRQFGFSRRDQRKGIVKVSLPAVVKR